MKVEKPLVVLDTNVLLVSISSKSKYHWVLKKLLDSNYDLAISNEILTEYEEIITNKYNLLVADNIVRTLLVLPNVKKIKIYYRWSLIKSDPDDNKFTDCALSANANMIVTQDSHFDVLKRMDFPKIKVLDVNLFNNFLQR